MGRYGPETPGKEMGPTLALATSEANGAFEYLSFMNKRVQIQTVKNIWFFLCKWCPPGLRKQVRMSATSATNLKKN